MIEKRSLGCPREPEEVAELVPFFASGRSTFDTGAVRDLSGGRATARPIKPSK